MKSILIAFTAVLTILYGCGVQHHQRQIKKHTEKLKTKGVLIPKDTLYITKSDTVTAYYMRNDTIVERITITDTVTLEPTVHVETRYETRWKYKYKTKYIKEKTKQTKNTNKHQTKQTRAENRKSKWWLSENF
jgi:hypothetical protein